MQGHMCCTISVGLSTHGY